MKIRIDTIIVGNRFRKDPGDIEGLARNIQEVGLLQPICVTPRLELIKGWRRMEAVKVLCWEEIEAHVVDLEKIVDGQFSSIIHRKNFTISELVAIYGAAKPLVEKEARQRKVEGGRRGGRANGKHGGISPMLGTEGAARKSSRKKMGGRTRDLIARYSGGVMSGQNIERAAAVCAAAREDPARFGPLQDEMDCGYRSINSAWRLLRAMKDLDAIPQPPAPPPGKYVDEILLGDCLDWLRTFHDDTFDACWTDPYFGVGFRYGGVQEPINRDPVAYWNWLNPIYREIVRVCKPGALLAVNQSLYYLRHFWAWFGDDINFFAYCKTFIPIYNMSDFTWAWHPVVVTHKPGAKKLYPRKKCRSLNHYTSTVPCDDVARLHPCPLPPDFCETFLKSFTVENAWVLDAFCGSGSIPLACFNTGRRFTGIEMREDYVDLARKRLWKAAEDSEERRRKAE